jgi:dolichol-phosphate mannosyltransferase
VNTTIRVPSGPSAGADLTIVLPALHEGENLARLLPDLQAVLHALSITHEILIVTSDADDATKRAASAGGARIVLQEEPGYGGALMAGFAAARASYILTMDADLSHPAAFVRTLWRHRDDADVIVASRYVPGGRAEMPRDRYLLSRLLNRVFSRGLSLRVRDMSSGFRLFHAHVVHEERFVARDFDIVQEVLVKAYAEGWRVAEVPFHYQPRGHGSSHARVLRFGLAYLRTFSALWRLRNSIECADYDARAYDSVIPLQRYWQRRRFHHVVGLVRGEGAVLDVGCGSSRIIGALPPGSVALDLQRRKLRYARSYAQPLVQASGFALPFADATFPCVLCSQVIEHVAKEGGFLDELCRVLRPGGRLVIGTPDYARWEWILMERLYGFFAPGAYADEHIARYTREELLAYFGARGYRHEATHYILRGELILAFRKPA